MTTVWDGCAGGGGGGGGTTDGCATSGGGCATGADGCNRRDPSRPPNMLMPPADAFGGPNDPSMDAMSAILPAPPPPAPPAPPEPAPSRAPPRIIPMPLMFVTSPCCPDYKYIGWILFIAQFSVNMRSYMAVFQ
jgi:hypothetical protein